MSWLITYLDRKHWRGDENGLDFEGHATDSQIDEAIPQLEQMALFMKLLEHGRTIHGMKEFSPDFYNKVRASIREGYCDLEDELCEYGECCC